jgi:CubicO group peptidase (beta-lactamase class C family)
MGKNTSLTRRSFMILAASLGPAYRLDPFYKLIAPPDQAKKIYVCPPCGLNCDKLEFDKPGPCPVCGMTLVEKAAGENESARPLTIEQLMKIYNIPGLSVAIIENFKIASTRAYGVTEAGGTTPVTPRTLFQAGSVSKPVAAAGALYLVERGKVSLDEDVNRKLKSWKLPENEFTKEQKVTLRRIMSHSVGLTVHGFPGYAVGQPIPTLPQVLNGEKPANTAPVRVDSVPGTRWRYSGGGVLIEQQLMIDLTGEPFPQLMREIVFDKIGMNDSTYEQPLPASRLGSAASGTDANGKAIPGKWQVYPEMAAAGLWTTPSDLAKFAIEIALSKLGKSNRVLSQTTTNEMLKPQMARVEEIALGNEQHRDRMGLGFFLGTRRDQTSSGTSEMTKAFRRC